LVLIVSQEARQGIIKKNTTTRMEGREISPNKKKRKEERKEKFRRPGVAN